MVSPRKFLRLLKTHPSPQELSSQRILLESILPRDPRQPLLKCTASQDLPFEETFSNLPLLLANTGNGLSEMNLSKRNLSKALELHTPLGPY